MIKLYVSRVLCIYFDKYFYSKLICKKFYKFYKIKKGGLIWIIKKFGSRIRYIRENELKMTREEFAELLELSISTIVRLENPNKNKVTNVETYFKVAQATGYSLEELLVGIYSNKNNREIKRINYILNVLSKEELNYIFKNVQEFTRFMHKKDTKTLKNIKKNLKWL